MTRPVKSYGGGSEKRLFNHLMSDNFCRWRKLLDVHTKWVKGNKF